MSIASTYLNWYKIVMNPDIADWHTRRWSIPLDQPPILVQMGVGVHGVAGATRVEEYRLPDLWCLHLYRYEAELEIAGERFPIRPGYASVVPPDVPMRFRYFGRSTHLYCHFRCPGRRRETMIPAMQELGKEFAMIYHRYHDLASRVDVPSEQRQAMVWDILWSMTEGRGGNARTLANVVSESTTLHPAVWQALNRIEQRLAEPLCVSELAKEVGVSYSYLGRLFQQSVGKSVVRYIRHRRVERATHLLCQSTLPIKSVAAAVGIPDLHLFNKVIHQTLGSSPRAFRQANYRK